MKEILFALVTVSISVACKKNTTNSNALTNDTSCGGNTNINFSSIGSPIGEFAECIKDVDGNVYKTVEIGNQQWMAENLKVSKYNDGVDIFHDTTYFKGVEKGAWANYNNNKKLDVTYGKLYNWYTVSTKKICPIGYHVPNQSEWNELISFLGGDSISSYKLIEVGNKNWVNNNSLNTNLSLFSAIPGGGVQGENCSDCGKLGFAALYWTSSEDDITDSWFRYLVPGGVFISNTDKDFGMSIRCLKD
jgi:uncharacterized protein (TIGR02145 family)